MATVLPEPPVQAEQPPKTKHWLRRGTLTILALAALLWASDAAISILVQHSRLRTNITARLEAAFGRPVEVGSYGFTIWSGPVLEAHSVRIGEDPRFGSEYFIRADSISVGLRWWSLLRGRLALGTLAVNGASLNLVRSADGDWNLAEWLPRPSLGESSVRPASELVVPSPELQFRRIDISDSRIDFKRGSEKLAFALVDVNGSMESDALGRWRIDMTAAPWRAATLTQQPGIIRVTGHIGGTSSRLRPAAIEIAWTDASIADFFRLASGDDYGLRGDIAVSLSAHTDPAEPVNGWLLNGTAELRGLHRWDMAARPDNPAVDLVVSQAVLDPGLSELRIPKVQIEEPHSNAHASLAFNWTAAAAGKGAATSAASVDLLSSQIDLGDVLAWVRGFRPGIPDGTLLRGMLDVRARWAGWPPALASASVKGDSAEVISPALHGPARMGPLDLRFSRGAISLQPATITWASATDRAAASFRIEAFERTRKAFFPTWHVAGSAEDARGIAALAGALGFSLSREWNLQGPLSCDLRWQSARFPWDAQPAGMISVGTDAIPGGAALRASFLNLPVEQMRARVELKPGLAHIALTSAKAFGANWTGTFDRRAAGGEWQFALSADRIAAADLDRWLNPRWRESFLGRMLPVFGAQTSPAASPQDVRGSGTLKIGEFTLEPLALRQITGNLRVDGRHLELSNAKAKFYGGQLSGLLRADLNAIPIYRAEIGASRVDAAPLVAAVPALAGLSAKMVDGQISIDAKGASRGDLISSISCRGTATADGVALGGLDLANALDASSQAAQTGRISAASAAFTCSRRAIHFQRLSLDLDGGSSVIGTGSIGFDRGMDLRFFDVSPNSKTAGASFRLAGNISSPQLLRAPSARRVR
ncbi:MAG: AsmA family protein [Acidobacteriota bacterium]|nr:AsmA family protein [Acidobacteriota bacterium]